MANTPDSMGEGPKNIEGGVPAPVSKQELNAMLAKYTKMSENLNIKITEGAPSEDVKYTKFLARKAELDVISNTPNLAPQLATIDAKLAKEGLSPEVREELVGESVRLQKEALIFIPDFAKPRGDADKTLRERTGDDLLREKKDGSQRFLLDVDNVDNKKVNPASAVEKKDDEVDMSYVEMAQGVPYGSLSTAPVKNNETKSLLNVKFNKGQWELNKTPEGKIEDNSLGANPEDYAAVLARKVEKSKTLSIEQTTQFLLLTKESAPKVEKTIESLEKRKDGVLSRMEALGLHTNKAIEGWKKVNPVYKMALGFTLGAVGLGVVTTAMSTAVFAKMLNDSASAEAFRKEGTNKWLVRAGSLAGGLLLALGSGVVGKYIGETINEHAPGVIASIKDFFSPETVAAADSLGLGQLTAPVGPDVAPHSPVSIVTPDIATAPQTVTESAFSYTPDITAPAPVEVVTQPAVESVQPAPVDQYLGKIEVPPYVPSAINFGDMDYTIKAGDTYSNIMDRILPHVRGVELLDPTSKAELLKNFHEQYSSTGTFSGLSSYPDMISNIDGAKVGTEIRVDQLRGALEEEVKRRFPGNFSN